MQLKMRRIGVAVDPPRQPDRPCAKRREGTVPIRRFLVPRRETTGRDRPFPSSCRSAAERRLLNRREGDVPGKRRSAEIAHFYKRGLQEAHSVGMRDLSAQRPRRGPGARGAEKGPPRVSPGRASAHARENAPCWPAASCSPTDYTAVPSALGGLTSGFGTGPGVPPLPWPPANKGRSHPPAPPVRALRAAQRSKASLQGRDRDRMPSPRRREGG